MCRVDGDAPKPIGRTIKRAREKRRWSQKEAADALGVSRSTLNKWENDRAYPRSAIGALEELYGISLDEETPRDARVPPELADKPDMVEPVRRRYRDPQVQARVLEAMAAAIRGEPQPPTEPGEAARSPRGAREQEAG